MHHQVPSPQDIEEINGLLASRALRYATPRAMMYSALLDAGASSALSFSNFRSPSALENRLSESSVDYVLLPQAVRFTYITHPWYAEEVFHRVREPVVHNVPPFNPVVEGAYGVSFSGGTDVWMNYKLIEEHNLPYNEILFHEVEMHAKKNTAEIPTRLGVLTVFPNATYQLGHGAYHP